MSESSDASAGRAQRPPLRRLGPAPRGGPRPEPARSGSPDPPPPIRVSQGERSRRVRCLLTTLSPERALSRALVQHLSAEMPGIQFRLTLPDGDASPDALWICGYRPGNASLVQRLRRRHPAAALVVTGRGPTEAWAGEVLRAGADTVCTWPLPYTRLAELLRQGRGSALA